MSRKPSDKSARITLAVALTASAAAFAVATAQDSISCRSDQTPVWVNGRYVCRANASPDGTSVRAVGGTRSPVMTGGAQPYPGATPAGQQSGLVVNPQGSAGSTGKFDSPQQAYGGTVPAAQQQGLRVTPQGGYYMLPPPAPPDQCNNIGGDQISVPTGYVSDGIGNCYLGQACSAGTLYSAQKVEDYGGLGQDACNGGDIIGMSYQCASASPPTIQISTNVKDAAPLAFNVTAWSFDREYQFSNCIGRWQGTTTCNGSQCSTQVAMSIWTTALAICGYYQYSCDYGDGSTTWCVGIEYCDPPQVVKGLFHGTLTNGFSYTTNIQP